MNVQLFLKKFPCQVTYFANTPKLFLLQNYELPLFPHCTEIQNYVQKLDIGIGY